MFSYVKRSTVMRNPDGSVVFQMDDIEVPSHWSQMATDILAQKYFRKIGVPETDENGNHIYDESGKLKLGSENSIRQVVNRLAGCWRDWGHKHGYFDSETDADIFYDEIAYMLLRQIGSPNSPQWFNTGLYWAYDITGRSQGHYYIDPETRKLKKSADAYSRPQPHACFIQSIADDLVSEGGIFDLAQREALIFKFGSGSGTNFSNLRGEGEKLSGGGISSGLMSFLKIFDRAAGAIKSGGTTRRAAKMVIVDIDHPDVEAFIAWKAREEEKVAAMVAGSKINKAFLQAILDESVSHGSDRKTNINLNLLIKKATRRGVPVSFIQRVLDLVAQGFTSLDFESFSTHYEGEAYITVSGQNSNNTVRITNEFMRALENDDMWELHWRTNGKVCKRIRARQLWEKINLSAWKSADPGLQFDTTINEWHTCPNSGRINASNPCSEYMFLDDTACNLASLNLLHFLDEETLKFRIDDFRHAVRLWTVVLETSVLMAQFPSKTVAQKSYDFRTLGLGYANLGTLLMISGIPYDSPEALAITGAISAILTGQAYLTSSEMAKQLGPFPSYEDNQKAMLRVIANHRRAAYNCKSDEYDGLTVKPIGIDPVYCPEYLFHSARKIWDSVLDEGEQHGFRNAQVTVLAPTGTIGLVMDCDTTGIEPDFAIVKYKKLAGGGYFKIVNQSVRKALEKLHYTEKQIEDIEKYCKGTGSLAGCPTINKNTLKEKGFGAEQIEIIEKSLDNVFDIKFAFNKWALGVDFCKKLAFTDEQINDSSFDMLLALGFKPEEIDNANDYICGTMMLEGAPHLNAEHLPIFDTANKCGKRGVRNIQHMAHVRMMAAAQPFISGAISKTVNMTAEATVADIGEVYMKSWRMMLKAIAIYRDGSKLSQPLNTKSMEDLEEKVTLGDEDLLDESVGPEEAHAIAENKMRRAERVRLPKKRHGHIREALVGGHKVYLRTGEYDDGSLGEIFIDMYKEGAAFRGLLNSFAILASKALQYGIPLEELVDSFTFTRFEPAGFVDGHEAIRSATSILDYVFRSLGYDYLNRTDFVHIEAVEDIIAEDDDVKDSTDSDVMTEAMDLNNMIAIAPIEEHVGVFEPKTKSKPSTSSNGGNGGNGKPHHHKKLATSKEAKAIGFTGEQCMHCGSMRVRRNGSCTVCEDCGGTSGCS